MFDAVKEKNNNLIGSKIKEARKKKGITLKDLKILLEKYNVDVKLSSISKWETGETSPNPYQLIALCHELNIQNIFSLPQSDKNMYGRLNKAGKAKVKEYINDIYSSGLYLESDTENDEKQSDDKKVLVASPQKLLKLFFNPVSAGIGESLTDEEYSYKSFPSDMVPAGADYCLKISGNSMEPKYFDGDFVFVKETDVLDEGDVGIFVYEGEGYIKEYGHVGNCPALISLNQKYRPIKLRDTFYIKGKVLN